MKTNKLPKILFIADEIPQSINAGSIQFFRLFKNYPSEKLMVFGRKVIKGAELLDCEYHTIKMPILDRIRISRFMPYLTDLQSIGLALPSLPKKLKKIADDFKPEIVISLMQLLPFYYTAYHYSKKNKIPLILFCHDDVEDFAKPHSFFKGYLIKLNTRIYQFANKRICISPEMVKVWKEKYKAEGNYLYPIASENIQKRDIVKAETLVNESYLTIGYAGSLAYGYREGINEIIPTLEKTGSKLKIYRSNDSLLKHSTNIEFAGCAKTPEETWDRIIKECDAVILPYSTEGRFEKLYRTHFPSKLTEYLMLQIPVIIIGPQYANGINFGTINKNALVCSNLVELEKNLVEILTKSHVRRHYSLKSLPIDLSCKSITNKLYESLISIIESK